MKHIKQIAVVFMAAITLSLVMPDVVPVAGNIATAQSAIKISKKSYRMVKGTSLQLKLIGTKKKAKWTSSKPSVATVTQKGKVSSKRKGTSTITAKLGKKKYDCKIYVEAPTISPGKTTINVGKSTILRLKGTKQKVTWKSSNTKIASVRNGKVTGRKTGNVKVTATVQKKKYFCNVTVNNPTKIPVSTFYLSQSSICLKKGSSQTLGSTILPQNATNKDVKWESSNSNIASVSNGKISALNIGNATITATCDNKSAICYVKVESDFNKEIAEKNISYSSQDLYFKCFIFAKNNYKYPVKITATSSYFKNGGVVARNSSSNYYLAPGKESILVTSYYPFWGSFDTHNIDISVDGPGEETSDPSGIICDVKPTENGQFIEFTNTSSKTGNSTSLNIYSVYDGEFSLNISKRIFVKNVGSKETFEYKYSSIPDKFFICLDGTVVYSENIK